MSRNAKYSPLDGESSHMMASDSADQEDIEMGDFNPKIGSDKNNSGAGHTKASPGAEVFSPMATAVSRADDFTLKVLLKETSFEVLGLGSSSTVADLKAAIFRKTQLPIIRQRCIFSGKQLKPPEATLGSFKILNKSSIHLFPLPGNAPAANSNEPVGIPVAGGGSGGGGLLRVRVDGAPAAAAYHQPVHFDNTVANNAREVRMWCIVLMCLSGLSLFNNLSYLSSTGTLGASDLDSAVNGVDILLSIAGMYVSQLGVSSARSMNLDAIKMYAKSLTVLGICSIMLRIMWVVDIYQTVEAAKKDQENENNDTTATDDGKHDNNNNYEANDAYGVGDPTAITESVVESVMIQALLIALICMYAWAHCVSRAFRFQEAVQQFSEPPRAATATTTTTTPATVVARATAQV